MNLLHMSFAGAMMIAVILLIRLCLQHRLHRTVLLVLWLAAVLRLMVPLRIPFRYSVFNLFSPADPELRAAAVQATTVQTAAVQAAPVTAPLPFWTTQRILLVIWAAGFAAVMGFPRAQPSALPLLSAL